LAVAALGFKWLSPISSLYERAGWTDVLFAAAVGALIVESARARRFPKPRPFHVAIALYVLAAIASAAFANAKATAASNVLLIVELALIALLTSEFASDRQGRDAVVLLVTGLALATAVLAAVGLALFYAGVHTSLIGAYGEQFVQSGSYARIAAGFESPPLLASFCIFASAVVDLERSPLPRRLRIITQLALSLLVISTFSRGAIAFFAMLAVRGAYARLPGAKASKLAAVVVLASLAIMAALTVGRLHLDPTRPSTVSYQVPDPGNRREAFVTALDTFVDHPLLGKGPGSLVARNRGEPFRAHFTPLNVAATLGLPALAALVFLVVVLWRERRRPTSLAIWTGLLGLGIDGLGQDIEHFRHVWALIGLADAERSPP
jgi:hypothetical protein